MNTMLQSTDTQALARRVMARSQLQRDDIAAQVKQIVARVRDEGDAALFDYTSRVDHVQLTADTVRVTREEIDAIIFSVKNDQMPWTADLKQRTLQFQQILSRRDTRELLLLASCLHKRKSEKGLPTSELDMLHKVEGMVEQEFSFALNLGRAEIGQYIRDRL